jgi:hypothetical protein
MIIQKLRTWKKIYNKCVKNMLSHWNCARASYISDMVIFSVMSQKVGIWKINFYQLWFLFFFFFLFSLKRFQTLQQWFLQRLKTHCHISNAELKMRFLQIIWAFDHVVYRIKPFWKKMSFPHLQDYAMLKERCE